MVPVGTFCAAARDTSSNGELINTSSAATTVLQYFSRKKLLAARCIEVERGKSATFNWWFDLENLFIVCASQLR
jgi:hypothetical protein